MEKKWWFRKNNEPAQDFEEFDNDYYGDAASVGNDTSADGAYDIADSSDVSVVLSAPEKDEPLMKRTFIPATCDDSQDIVDAFKQGRVIVICIEELDKPNFLRLFDYIMGAVHALDGSLERIDRDTVVLFPYAVDTETDVDELEEEAFEAQDAQYEDENDSEDLD